jgi:hypothetical protein
LRTIRTNITTNATRPLLSQLQTVQASLCVVLVSLRTLAKTVHRSLSSVKKRLASGRREQDALLRYQKVLRSKVMNRLDDFCSILTQQIATVRLAESADNEIVFEGENMGAITLPSVVIQMK